MGVIEGSTVVQLIKSLFCFKGSDSNERFILLSLISLLIFTFFNELILTSIISKLVLTVLFALIIFCSAIRRCRDANHSSKAAWLTTILYAIALFLVIVLPFSTTYSALLLPLAATFYLFAQPAKQKVNYIFGYNGPVDLSDLIAPNLKETQPRSQRIEPSLFGSASDNQVDEYNFSPESSTQDAHSDPSYQQDVGMETNSQPQSTKQSTTHVESRSTNQIANLLFYWFSENKKLMLVVSVVIVLSVAILIAMPLITTASNEAQSNTLTDPENSPAQVVTRTDLLEMPDNFYLLLDENNGLILHWQSDSTSLGEIWSLKSAAGDLSCSDIEFNNGDKIRTVNVVVEGMGDFYANFSPLDTEAIVQSLARRGNFSLCDYNFSLKGSQRALNSNPAYIDYAN
ncbi:MAG: hypothetical protein P8M49_00990 [Thalassotalea sp.]|nr:hypothetical protein [Thalassotalea sp.]MDG2392056.1 hypothetical protein [Thalassotalea sp.]